MGHAACCIQYIFERGGGVTPLHIPGRTTVQKKVMKEGEDTIKETRDMFEALESDVTIALDAWTSPNQHAFLAIIAHFISNDGQLRELLIDFKELIGKHTGENMADAVWRTLERYGLLRRVTALMMDNASNNDTLVAELERRFRLEEIPFSAKNARLRCMPHTIHLAALELLETIGAITKQDRDRAASRSGEYQTTVTSDANSDLHDEAVFIDDDEDEDESIDFTCSVARLRKIIRYVRASPQRRKAWLQDVKLGLQATPEIQATSTPLILILDVRTRWSSSYLMLQRALQYRRILDDYVGKNRELHPYDLTEDDWRAIELVASWLKSFHTATVQMSTTSYATFSSVAVIFRGLQKRLKNILRSLPDNTNLRLRNGIVKAHLKLSEYFGKFDISAYCTWASLLDPRISDKGLQNEYKDDASLLAKLESSKASLQRHVNLYYKPLTPDQGSADSVESSPDVDADDFMADYEVKDRVAVNELEEFWKLPREDIKTCDPIQWWFSRRHHFPGLYRLARNLLAIPGSAVAVERIFSGARDTISLRRASLKPQTIEVLMILKQKIKLARGKTD